MTMLEIRKVTPTIGVEVKGIDIRDLDDATFGKIYQAFLDNIVMVIRGQEDLQIEEYLRHSRRFGHVKPHIAARQRHPKYPDLMLLDNQVADQNDKNTTITRETLQSRGGGWHTDLSYEQIPAKATQLYPIYLPSYGGGTKFASSYAAYDALPQKLKTRIEGLTGNYKYGGKLTRSTVAFLDEKDRDRKPVVHALVKVHPETGRKSLYFDPRKVIGINGLDEAAANELMEELQTYYIQSSHEYQHAWQPGDIVIWDNRCAMHSAVGGYPPDERRLFWRVTIMEHDYLELLRHLDHRQ
jgi:taurine dioxygenase